MTDDNGWNEHKRLIEFRLDANDAEHRTMNKKLDEILELQREARTSKKVLIAGISAGTSLFVATIAALAKAYL
jgi:hypothetical protein